MLRVIVNLIVFLSSDNSGPFLIIIFIIMNTENSSLVNLAKIYFWQNIFFSSGFFRIWQKLGNSGLNLSFVITVLFAIKFYGIASALNNYSIINFFTSFSNRIFHNTFSTAEEKKRQWNYKTNNLKFKNVTNFKK